jgi:hypothetical protein
MQLISLADAARLFPRRNGKAPHIRTIHRRIHHGWNGVKLRAKRDGHQWFTSQEWIEEFMEACTRRALPQSQADVRATSWHHQEAKRRLKERYGIDVDHEATARIVAELEAEISSEEVPDLSGARRY